MRIIGRSLVIVGEFFLYGFSLGVGLGSLGGSGVDRGVGGFL